MSLIRSAGRRSATPEIQPFIPIIITLICTPRSLQESERTSAGQIYGDDRLNISGAAYRNNYIDWVELMEGRNY